MLEGMSQLKSKLAKLRKDARGVNASAVVGYIQTYTFPVHEDLTASHAAGTTAKFLEIPAVTMQSQLAGQIAKDYENTDNMPKTLLNAAGTLLEASQPLVPVDTGALRASGFACLERDLDAISREAFSRSESIRLSRK